MPSPSERNRNNVRAGVFVTLSILLGLGVMIILTDAIHALSRSTVNYTVTFGVASGVSNLKPGSEVRVGGVLMGKVTAIMPKLQEGFPFREIAVEFNVDRKIQIFADAHVIVSAPLIGADAWLDIPFVGTPSQGLPPNGQIVGTPSVGFLTTLLGSENAEKANDMVENARVFTDFLAEVPDEWGSRIRPTLDDVQATAADVRAVVGDFRQTEWPDWATSIDLVMTWATGATGKLDAAIADGHGLLTDGRTVVAENRQLIKDTLIDVKSVTGKFNSDTVDKVHKLLDTGQEGLEQAVRAIEDMRVDYASWATNLGDVLANANLAAQQLKLTTIETRRSPWKLLYRPSSDELEHELLYEAARSFAVAAADLKAASESVQRVLANHGDKIADNEQAYRRLERNLLDSLANYEKTQQQLLDVLISDGK